MKCVGCGAEIPNNASFCAKCGAKVGSSLAAQAGIPQASPADALRRTQPDDDVEQNLWAGGYSGKAMIGSWFGAAILTAGLIVAAVMFPPWWPISAGAIVVIWIVLLLVFAYRRLNLHYELTSQRLIHKTGILTRRSDRIEAIDIDDVTFEQGIVERMFGVGKIKITSSDRTHPEIVLIGIDDVKRVADLIDDARRKERRKRGIHIESV
jgi:membrane protein YdbS with pleckstrin-like domain